VVEGGVLAVMSAVGRDGDGPGFAGVAESDGSIEDVVLRFADGGGE
jgi:hypothetical protein